jgi:hypothetical protein
MPARKFACGACQVSRECPHCGATLPTVGDAFCSECLRSLDEELSQPIDAFSSHAPPSSGLPLVEKNPRGSNPLEHFSLPARIVIVMSVIAAGAGTMAYISWVHNDLPPGRYPLWFFALPVGIAAVLLCAAGLALLRVCGVPVHRKERLSPSNARDEQRELRG